MILLLNWNLNYLNNSNFLHSVIATQYLIALS